ncbi:MAG: glutaredoxin family protein [Candidatus Paceibacterota bacterium]
METKKVEIYSTETCHFCHMAKDWLKEKNIPFTDYNVGSDLEKRKEMVEITGQMGVPVIKIGNNVMVGFNPEQIAKMLEIAN